MQEIRCPKCGEVFQVDENGYNQIATQVRDKEFAIELERREKELEAKREQELQLIRLEEEKEYAASIAQKEEELVEKERTILELQAKLETSETVKSLAVSEALEKRNEEFSKATKEHSENLIQKEAEIADRDKIIAELKAKLESSETEKKLAVAQAVEAKTVELNNKAMEIVELKGELKSKEDESRLSEQSLKAQYEEKLKLKDEQIEYYKDFKARQSTKMIGESLEQHCLTQFNSIRMTAFPNAYFEKDNDARSGSKGDFIYREYGDDGTEFISIRSFAAASSIKSMALSGKKRLVMYRCESSTAATIASSRIRTLW